VTRSDALSALWLIALLCGVAYVSAAPARMGPLPAHALIDASGQALLPKPYQRIASASAYADQLLLALAEPERVIALSRSGRSRDADAFRYGARAQLSAAGDLEQLLALHVDLLLVNQLGSQAELARVRAAGIAVFDLGEMRGLANLRANIEGLARALGDPERGRRLYERWSRRLRAVARDVPPGARKPALYVANYAGKLYGGTRGSSYHDVLDAAGLVDVAAERYRDWPNYDPEQLLALDPPLIVTELGMGEQLCANVWLRALSACRARALVELPSQLIGDAGLGMLEAAEALHDRVYPPQP
jgi:iron complex transport system substrate-binding protein